MAKERPKTGEPREVNQPLKIDKLPPIVHRAIIELYNKHGLSWQEIEDLSEQKFGQKWDDEVVEDEEGNVSPTTKTPPFKVHPGRGFVPWDNLPMRVLELFPNCRLPHSNLARWYDLRFRQVQESMQVRSAQARELAAAFASSVVDKQSEAVTNAIRDQLLAALSEDNTATGRLKSAKALLSLAEVLQTARANDIKERKVAADERKLKLMEQREKIAIQKLEDESAKLSKKAAKGEVTPADMDRLRERVFGLPPKRDKNTEAA